MRRKKLFSVENLTEFFDKIYQLVSKIYFRLVQIEKDVASC